MKKQLLLFVMMVLPFMASAHDIEVKNADDVTIYYNYINNGTELEVTFRGSYYDFYSNEYQGNVVIPEEVTFMNRTRKVTSIGTLAFADCSGLTSVTIPNSVTSIEYGAFSVCLGLTSVTIPNSVTSIGDGAFDHCSGLTSVTIPNSVTSIGDDAFRECSSLTSVTIGNSVTSIGGSAFSGCSGLTSVTIPNSVTSIGHDAFGGCSGLTSVTIGNSVTSIGNRAFSVCSGLTSITIPNSVTSIGHEAFYRCSGLTSITIPNSVTSIGVSAFRGCSGLTSIVVENGNSNYDSRSNCNAIIETATNTLIFGCKNTIIPNSVTSFGNDAFYGCLGLTSITIPNSVTRIGDGVFDGVDLTTVVSLIENPFVIGRAFSVNTFYNATLYVPVGTIDKYKATDGWKDFAYIVEGTPTGIKVIENTQNKNATVYDLNGVRLSEPKKGINIINGQKVIVK